MEMMTMEQMNELAKTVFDALGGKDISYENFMGFLKAMEPARAIAKNNSHVFAQEAKQLNEAQADELHKYLKVGDKVDYLLKSQDTVFEDLPVQKLTDKRFHVEVVADTPARVKGALSKAGDIAGLKLGKKYVAFTAIQSINGLSVSDFLAKAKGEKPEAVVVHHKEADAQELAKVAE